MQHRSVKYLISSLHHRHSLGGSDISSPGGGGEYHSSQGDSHGFRGLAPSPRSAYGSYNSPSERRSSWGQGGREELGWNSSSPHEQRSGYSYAERQRTSGGYGSPSPGGGQSSWSYGGAGIMKSTVSMEKTKW